MPNPRHRHQARRPLALPARRHEFFQRRQHHARELRLLQRQVAQHLDQRQLGLARRQRLEPHRRAFRRVVLLLRRGRPPRRDLEQDAAQEPPQPPLPPPPPFPPPPPPRPPPPPPP